MGRVYRRHKVGSWSVDYVDAKGQRIRRVVGPDKREAETALKALEERERQKRVGLLPMVDNGVLLAEVTQAYLDYLRNNRRQGTVDLAEYAVNSVLRLLDRRTVADIRPVDMERIRSALSENLSQRSVSIILSGFKRMLTWAVRQGLIASNPIKHLGGFTNAPSSKRRALTREEVELLLLHSPGNYSRMWFAFLSTGMRRNELVELRWRDVDLAAGVITIRPEVAKTKRQRTIPMPSALRDVLVRMHRERMPGPDVHVFLNEAGRPWRNNLLKRLKRCLREAGINRTGVDLHALRYTYGTLLYHGGVDVKTLQSLLGHSTIRTTLDIYVKDDDDVRARAVECLPFLANGNGKAQLSEASQKALQA